MGSKDFLGPLGRGDLEAREEDGQCLWHLAADFEPENSLDLTPSNSSNRRWEPEVQRGKAPALLHTARESHLLLWGPTIVPAPALPRIPRVSLQNPAPGSV
jgi:hypothetical protein